ncbi:MAG TPA: CAP domain-containing protein, partial [Albitalea sp.]|nr:CAP domain-containing protein [Albitalea sp.]
DFAAGALARVNQWRARGADCGSEGRFGAAPALAWNDLLAQAAAAHSEDMVAHDFFSHTGSNGSTLGQRVDAVGYAWSSVGENIAAGQPSVNEVVDGWIASPGHCANIMNPGFVHMGLACVRGTAADAYPTYWTMDLAAPR